MIDLRAVVPETLTAPVAAALLNSTTHQLARLGDALPNQGRIWRKYRKADVERLAGRPITINAYVLALATVGPRRAAHSRYNEKRRLRDGGLHD